MKKISFILNLLLAMMLMACGGSSDTEEPTSGKDSFSLSTNRVEIGREAETFSVTVTSNMDYYISAMPDWITEVTENGRVTKNTTHTFHAEANPKAEERQDVIVFCNEAKQCVAVTVVQSKGTPVVTGWEDKKFYHHSLAMRFTADWCVLCPLMAGAFQKVQEQNPDKIEVVSLHCEGGLMFNEGRSYAKLFKVIGYPHGVIDGRISTYLSDEEIVNEVVKIMQETENVYGTQTGISFESSLNGSDLKVDVKLYLKKASQYRVNVLLIENNIVAYQSGGGDNYVHNEVVRLAPSKLPGNEFITKQDNMVKAFSYTGTVPTKCNKDNLRILVFVEQTYGTQEKIRTDDYGKYYVDNSLSEAVGVKAELRFAEE